MDLPGVMLGDIGEMRRVSGFSGFSPTGRGRGRDVRLPGEAGSHCAEWLPPGVGDQGRQGQSGQGDRDVSPRCEALVFGGAKPAERCRSSTGGAAVDFAGAAVDGQEIVEGGALGGGAAFLGGGN